MIARPMLVIFTLAVTTALPPYPAGEPDELWMAPTGGPWEQVPLLGGWFPDAFIGTMSNLQRYAAGEDAALCSSVHDAWQTMALVEACYRSNVTAGTPVATPPLA